MRICGAVLLIIIILGIAKFWDRKTFLVLLAGAGLCLAAAIMNENGMQNRELTALEKNEAGEGNTKKDLIAKVGDEEVSLQVTVPQKEYEEEEIRKILAAECEKLPERILGENTSFQEIRYDLPLPSTGLNPAVSIRWFSSDQKVLGYQGKIGEEADQNGSPVTLTAYLQMEDRETEFTQELTVFPKALTGDMRTDLEREIALQNRDEQAQEIVLPDQYEGQPVYWFEAPETSASVLAGLLLVIGILLYVNSRNKEEKLQKQRMERLRKEYPDMVSRLLMMLYSGISMRKAFYRIAASYQREKRESDHPMKNEAFEEVVVLCREIDNGVTETQAYEHMAERCALPAYRTLCVLLVQNQKRGGAGIMDKMEQEVITAFGEKRRMARMAGDAASLKLLLPMGLMLMIAFALMLVPAFLSL